MKKGEQGSRFVPVRYQQKKDGTIFPVEISAASFISNGRKKLIGAVRDITDRLKSEKELLKTKMRLQHLLATSPTVIYAADPQNDFATIYMSENVQTQLGYQPQDFLDDPKFTTRHIHPEDLPGVREKLANIEEQKGCILEYRFRNKDGNYRWMWDEIRVHFNQKGSMIEAVGSWIDITDRVQAEEKLRESEERFRNLVENSLIGIAIIQENKFVYQNQVQHSFYGPISDKSIFDAFKFIHQDDQDKIKKAYEGVLSGKTQTAEADLRFYPSGKIGSRSGMRWVQCRATPFNYYGKDAILVNTIDITEAKQLEHQLIIKNKMLSLGRVAAGIAHEIRNPLTGINSYLYTLAELCRSETFESEDIEMMQQIVDQIFDPFFTTKEDGQGIGLNIAQRIIADHNGSLSLDTSKWGGAEFRIELPVEKRMDPR